MPPRRRPSRNDARNASIVLGVGAVMYGALLWWEWELTQPFHIRFGTVSVFLLCAVGSIAIWWARKG